MLENFQNHINKNLNFLTENKLLIAISGGLDSVVLTHLCYNLKLNIALAHCNFNLRGKESDADENFVLQLAEDLNLEVFIQNFETETYAKQHKLSTQMSARELRYQWFKELSEQLGFHHILTAHHADDNLETFLINLSRGTGLEGLTGIPEINENLVRPLLPFSRVDIEEYAKAKNLQWREDSSNASAKYLRNKLRLEVIPKLKEINPQLLQNFKKTIAHLQGSKVIIDDSIGVISNRVIQDINDDNISFNITEINKLSYPKAYLYELLKDYNFTQWNDIYDLLEAQSGKQIFSKTHRLTKDRGCLLLSEINCQANRTISISETDKKTQTPFGILYFDEVEVLSKKDLQAVYVDKELLKFPLTVRQWQESDYFYPFGMIGKKKLSKYFKDEKLSLIDKENVWLLCSENNIVWVINRRADNRFKVTEKTKQIIKIELQ